MARQRSSCIVDQPTQEILTKKLPYNHIHVYGLTGTALEVKIMYTISKGKLPSKPVLRASLEELIWRLCGFCWRFDSRERPTAIKVNKLINRFRDVRLIFFFSSFYSIIHSIRTLN